MIYVVFFKNKNWLPNLSDFGFDGNLLECRNLKLVLEAIEDINITIKKRTNPRERSPTFVTQLESGIQCLNRTEHFKASSYYLNELQIAANNVSCSDKSQPETKEQEYHMIIIQFITTILILCCITLIIWHGVYLRNTVNFFFGDNGDYCYCNYFRENVQNFGQT